MPARLARFRLALALGIVAAAPGGADARDGRGSDGALRERAVIRSEARRAARENGRSPFETPFRAAPEQRRILPGGTGSTVVPNR